MTNIIYLEIAELRKLEGFRIYKYLKRYTIEEQLEYKRYCRNKRQMKFRNANHLICNERSRICMRKKIPKRQKS